MIIRLLLILSTIVILSQPAVAKSVKAFSLRAASEKLRACQQEESCGSELTFTGGIRQVDGFIIDRDGSDVILYGRADVPGVSPLYLDDFIVALRAAYKKYAEGNVFEYPGCSIDPAESTVRELNNISAQMAKTGLGADPYKYRNDWISTCMAPQTVSIEGVPFHSHFAQIMVKADYDMKKIVDGTDKLEIKGLEGMPDMMADEAEAAFRSGSSRRNQFSTINRFWFTPATLALTEAQNSVELRRCDIKLLTEQKYIAQSNKKYSGPRLPTNHFAEKVASAFTKNFDTIASRRPVFDQLRHLLRWYVIAEAIRYKRAFAAVGLPTEFLLDDYELWVTQVDETLPGRSRYKVAQFDREVSGGSQSLIVAAPICGGVYYEVKMDQSTFSPSKGPDQSVMEELIVKQRPGINAVSWNADVPD